MGGSRPPERRPAATRRIRRGSRHGSDRRKLEGPPDDETRRQLSRLITRRSRQRLPIVAEFDERDRPAGRLDRSGQIRHCEPFMTGAAHLTSGVLAAVLGAALLHALWNSLVKSADDKFLSSALVALWCGVAAFAATLVLPWPSRAAAPFVVASALIHIVYFLLVGRLYRNADLSVAYPIMRGLAPLIAAPIALATLGEAPGPVAVLGIVILVFGVMLMGASGLAHGRIDAATLAVALANSVVIAVYSVIDGQGGRISGPSALFAFAYNAWADALTAVAYAPIVLLLRGRSVPSAFVRDGGAGWPGGWRPLSATPS